MRAATCRVHARTARGGTDSCLVVRSAPPLFCHDGATAYRYVAGPKPPEHRLHDTVPEYALLFGPGGIAAARDYAEEHDLEVSEPRLEPEAIARRDTELRREKPTRLEATATVGQ
jgi:hypothetical protein